MQLDRGAEPDARIKSQSEVREIGAVLKRLREGTRSEFACFKTPRGGTGTGVTASVGGGRGGK